MAWWMAVPAAMQVAGSVANALGQNAQADLVKERGNEQARRLRLQHAATLGEGTARAAASGFESGVPARESSMQTYLTQMADEFRREEDWIRKSADAEASAMKKSAVFGALTGVGSSIFSFGQANNWWKTA